MYIIEETDTRFYIDKSTLPNAGLGCFAKELIKKNDFLEIIGVMVRNGSIADKCTHYAMRYKFAATLKKEAKIVPLGYGGMVNHTDDPYLQNVQLAYLDRGRTKRSEHSTQAAYLALRDIQPGEELLGNYGEDVGREIEKFNENVDQINNEKYKWERFLKHNLYGLKDLIDSLPNDNNL